LVGSITLKVVFPYKFFPIVNFLNPINGTLFVCFLTEVNMKTLISAVILFILFSVPVLSQENDSTRTQKKEVVKTEQKVKETVTARKRNKDVFIDKDGDGICDQRVKGLLFEKLRKRQRAGQNGGNGHQGGRGRQ